ncbi:hypothetical protein CHUAL_002917 [Chamberlinius hualienensis]
MRRSSPQHHQTSRGSDKPSSPRLTLRFQQVKGRDTRHGGGVSKTSEVSSSEPRYQSYCVTMETGEESAQQTSKRDDLDETGRGGGGGSGRDSQLNVVSSSKDNSNAGDPLLLPESSETVHKPSEVYQQHETNGDGVELKSGEAAGSDGEQDDNKRKRRRDGDSSPTFSATSPRNSRDEGSGQSQNSTNMPAASSVRTSEPESTHSDIDNSDDGCLKVPPLKIVIPPSTSNEKLVSRSALPYVVVPSSCSGDTQGGSSSAGNNSSGLNEESSSKEKEEERSHRVTRSSQRMQAALANSGANGLSTASNLAAASVTQDHSPTAINETVNVSGSDEHPPGGNEAPTHRKRKIRTKDGPSSSGSTSSSSSSHGEEQPSLNCYEMFLNIRKQIDWRRKTMYVVQPKPPQGFKDYLLNSCSYVLAGNAASRLSVPMIPPPQSLGGAMRDLFVSQEKERYNLRLQHQIEKEKLVLTVEQEILRVHGRAARAMANQTTPLSACTVLKDEEVYSPLEPEQDDRDRNARTRFTGRHLLSWLQDIDDKWDKVKEAMLLRHHNEAESLHAAQILFWECKMQELGLCESKTAPVADAIHVPMVHVSPSILASNGEVGSAVVKNSSFKAASGT